MTDQTLRFSRSTKSSTLTMGIVGLPNVGKSTIFNALTNQSVPAANYPFCTFDPSIGFVKLPDHRIDRLVSIYKPKSIVYPGLVITDIAGLIPDAHLGKGLGNAFLDHIRNCDGIFHVVRCFENEDIVHTEESVNPKRDIGIIENELRMKDVQVVEKKIAKIEADRKPKTDEIKLELKTLNKCLDILKTQWLNKDMNNYTEEEVKIINGFNLLTTKPMVILANISKDDYLRKKCNKHLKSILDRTIIPFSAELESENLSEKLIEKLGKIGYNFLQLINFYTAGQDEVKAWTIKKDLLLPKAGGTIHTDFEKYFVMGDVFNFGDIDEFGTEFEVRKQGKVQMRGKSYVVCDGDIIYFKSNPPKGDAKKKTDKPRFIPNMSRSFTSIVNFENNNGDVKGNILTERDGKVQQKQFQGKESQYPELTQSFRGQQQRMMEDHERRMKESERLADENFRDMEKQMNDTFKRIRMGLDSNAGQLEKKQ